MSNSEVQSEDNRRPYVVLEEGPLIEVIKAVLAEADVAVESDDWLAIERVCDGRLVYSQVAVIPSRNSAHALKQAGAQYERGTSPPLVAVSDRMFRPRTVDVNFEPKVSLT